MSSSGISLGDHVTGQFTRLCQALGVGDAEAGRMMLTDILGPVGPRRLAAPPLWPSDVADDHSPAEFSVALDHGRPPTLRLLAEAAAATGDMARRRLAAVDLLDTWATQQRVQLDRLRRVQDLFLPARPRGRFPIWFSLVLRAATDPAVKVYLNPGAYGTDSAGERVAEGLHRLGYGAAVPALLRYGTRSGALDAIDWPIFFALDLNPGPDARVKVYVAHEHATAATAARAARAAGIDGTQIEAFCRLAGGLDRYHIRPLISAYTFLAASPDRPAGYSLYLPIRSYVDDDQQAWDRVQKVAARHGHDPAPIRAGIDALTDRDLDAGVGLIAHVALRLAHGDAAGITTYLSSEAYQVTAPRCHTTTVTTAHGGSSTCR